MQIYHSIIKIQHEVQERKRKQNRAASVIQKAVRRFLFRKKQEKFSNGIIKIQVTENILILVQDFGLQFTYMIANI